MRLHESPYYGILEGKQKIEVRLLDEKRRKIKPNDTIRFYLRPSLKESFVAKVVKLSKYKSFNELFSHINLADWNAEGWTIEKAISEINKYYSKEEENKLGVIVIEVEVIK